MKNKIILSLSVGLMAIASTTVHAQISDQDKALMASFAEPYGIEKGQKETIYIPPSAHITEMLVFFDESNDTINGLFIYYQPNIDTDPVRSNAVGKQEGKLIRINVDWNDVINGLEVETSPGGALASFLLTTEKGAKRGFVSTLANGKSKQVFGNNLQFAGLTVRADKEKVYAMGLNLVPAQNQNIASNNSDSIKVFSAGDDTSTVTSSAPPVPTRAAPPKKSGFAKALEDFGRAVEQGKKDREFEADQERLRREQQAQRDRINANRQTSSRPTTAGTSTRAASVPRLGGNTRVILYEHCNYGGKAVGLSLGEWDTASLSRLGMGNDKVSSIKILNGSEVVASSNNYGRGGVNRVFRKNIPCLTNHSFNDVISYARVRTSNNAVTSNNSRSQSPARTPTRTTATAPAAVSNLRLGGNNKVILYEDCNYRGKAIGIYEGQWDTAALRRFGMENDKVSSIKILSGFQITASSNDYARGGVNKTFDRNIPCLTNHSFNDVLSYAVVRAKPALAFGQKPSAGTKARTPEELKWTPAGVTGLNVGAVYYDRLDNEGKVSQWGRFVITEEGSNIWNWYVMGPRNGASREDLKKPQSQYRVVSRTRDSVTLKGVRPGSVHSFIFNTRTKKIRGIQEATNGLPKLDFFNGVIKTQSRPQ